MEDPQNKAENADELLDFETAMRDFCTMFPTMTSSQIEDVLRQHDGDVAETIDHLLRITTKPSPPPVAPKPTSLLQPAASMTSSVIAQPPMTSSVLPPAPTMTSSAFRQPSPPASMMMSPPARQPSPPMMTSQPTPPVTSPPHVSFRQPSPPMTSSHPIRQPSPPLSASLQPPSSSAPSHPSMPTCSTHSNVFFPDVPPPRYSRYPEQAPQAAASVRSRRSRLSFDQMEKEQAKIARMKRENEKKLDHVTDEHEARVLEDEQYALLLQSRELSRCLKTEAQPRSMSYAGRRTSSRVPSYPPTQSGGPRVPEGPVLDDVIINQEPDFREKLRTVSKASKARLSQLTARFRRQSEIC